MGGNLSLYQNLSNVAVVGIIDIGLSLAINIFFPHIVSKEEFAALRIFLLYLGYAGFLHFGLLDGLYLHIVGHSASEVQVGIISRVRSMLWTMQCFIAVVALPLVFFFNIPDASLGFPLILVATVVAINLLTFHTYLFQATNQFRLVTQLVSIPRVLCAITTVLFIWLKIATAMNLAVLILASYIASTILLRKSYHSKIYGRCSNNVSCGGLSLAEVWYKGLLLYSGSIALSVTLTAGTLLASVVLERNAFADYAFAAGLVSLSFIGFEWLGVAAAPLYAEMIRKGTVSTEWEKLLLAMMWFSPLVYWGAVLVVKIYLPSYFGSLHLLAWLAGGLPFLGIVRSRAPALCRATGRQDVLFSYGAVGSVIVAFAVLVSWMYGQSAIWIAAGWSIAVAILGSVVWLVVTRVYCSPTLRREAHLVMTAFSAACSFSLALQIPNRLVGVLAYLVVGMSGFLIAAHSISRNQ